MDIDNIKSNFNREKIIENINNIDKQIKNLKRKIDMIETNVLKNNALYRINSFKNRVKNFNKKIVKNDYAGSLATRIIKFIVTIFALEFVTTLLFPIYPINFNLNHILYLIPIFLCKEVAIVLNIMFRYLPIKLLEKVSIKVNKIQKKKYTKKYYDLIKELEYNRSVFLFLLKQSDFDTTCTNKKKISDNIKNISFEQKVLFIEEQILSLNDGIKLKMLIRLRNIIKESQGLKENHINSIYSNYNTYCELIKLELDIIKINSFSRKNSEFESVVHKKRNYVKSKIIKKNMYSG